MSSAYQILFTIHNVSFTHWYPIVISHSCNPRTQSVLAGLPDLKSLGLNVATTLLILLPFALYFDRASERATIYVGFVVVTFILVLLIPPVGWWRPHPYSDFPSNRGRATRGN